MQLRHARPQPDILQRVSVSTSGSKGVQQEEMTFSIYLLLVSVSTSGSKGVQRIEGVHALNPNNSFSIHKRIEGGATPRPDPNRQTARWFQYPQADRRGCNFDSLYRLEWNESFSIHKRIEGGATERLRTKSCSDLFRFSIHKRIEGGATFQVHFNLEFDGLFQYPQADRRGCNKMKAKKQLVPLNVSVSTSGSKGVQPRGVTGR